MPEPLPTEVLAELKLRVALRHPHDDVASNLGRIEQAVDALRAKREKSEDWLRRIWGYLNQCDISEAKRAGHPHPAAIAVLKQREIVRMTRRTESLRLWEEMP